MKRSRSGVFQAIAGKPTHGQSARESYSIWFNSSNQIRMYIGNGTTYGVASSAALDTNWHHVAGTFDNATIRLYIDGVASGSTTTPVRLTPNVDSFYISRSSSSTTTNLGGLLDELAVYSTVLSPTRIQAHYNKAFADLTAPTVTLVQPANGSSGTSSTVSFSGVAGNAVGDSSTVSVKLYAGPSAEGAVAQTLTATRQGNNSYATSGTVADGQWTAQAGQLDAAGNVGLSSANTFLADATPPMTTISPLPVSPSSQSTATISFFASEPGTFACQLDATGFVPCSSPQSYSALSEGSHIFQVRATDVAGNTGPTASATWVVDTVVPPNPTITSAPPNPNGSTSASFAFSDTEPSVTFLCRLDTGAFDACTTPTTYDGLTLGTHEFDVKARDGAGNESGAASHIWTIDVLAPSAPVITAGPPDPTNSTAASFSFSSDQQGVTFECLIDSSSFESCTSPKTYDPLAAGSHTFSVRARDSGGVTSPATSYPWTIITDAPPAPTITSAPPDPSSSTGATFGFTVAATGVTFECQLDQAALEPCTDPKSYSGLTEGSHTFQVKARDAADNESAPTPFTWTIDTTAPSAPTITSAPANPSSSPDATFAFEAGQPLDFECELDGTGGFSPCTSPFGYSSLADGDHTFRVRAVDEAGNIGEPTSYSWTISTSEPDAPTITSSPPDSSNATSATFAFTGSPSGVSFLCRLDGASFATCLSPKGYGSLLEGSHTFDVKARNAAGTESTVTSHIWVIDLTPPPPPTINPRPTNPSNEASPSFGFAGEAGATFACDLDGGGFSSCTSPHAYAGIADGSHTFRVKATDAAGNTGAATTYTWTIDTAPPPPPTIGSGPSDPTNSTTATFGFSDTEAGTTLLCRLDGAAFAACTSPKAYSALTDGSHSFQVKARDAAGNESAATTRAWTVDTVGPSMTIAANPPNPSNTTAATFGFFPSESASTQCKLDAGAFTACTSPSSYSGLAQGSHTFSVKGTDQAGNTGTTTTYTWRIDSIAPAITLSTPANGASTSADLPTFSGTAGTASGDLTTVTVKVYAGSSVGGTPLQTLTATSGSGGAYSVVAAAALSPGTYTARAEQPDDAANLGLSAANTFTVTDPVMIGAGDIADCGDVGDEATGALLQNYPDALVYTLGDNTYPNGAISEFANCYDPSWGHAKARTRPALGDHDYADGANPNATGYMNYFQQQLAPFGPAALDPTKGWYSYDVGTWHVAVTNADCGTGDGSLACSQDEQEAWLRADLAAHPSLCNLVIVHEPRWSSGAVHGNTTFVQRYWGAAYDHGVDIVLSGSDHIYERFAPQDGTGALDTTYGVREFIVGTGGVGKYAIGTPKPNSEVRSNAAWGLLKLTLHPTGYDWQFVPEAGKTFTDTGTTDCHGTPPPPPAEVPEVRNVASNSGDNVQSLTIAKPLGTVQGDLLVALVSHQSGSNRTMTPPAGWTAIPGTDIFEGTNARMHGWYRFAGASEPASYAFTLSGSDGRDTVGGILAITGADASTPINASAGQANATSVKSITAPSITTSVPNTLLIFAGAGHTAATYTPPGNMAEQFDVATKGQYKISSEVATQALLSSGPTGTRTALASTQVRSVGVAIAIRPH